MSDRVALLAMAPAGEDGDDGGDGGRGKPKKAPNAFRTISEVADELHIPQHVLRFWETKFPQVKPLKRGGGRRYYRPDDIALLRRVSDLLYIQGYTIKGVQRLLREGGGRLSDDIPPAPPEEREEGEAAEAGSDAPELPMPGLTSAASVQAVAANARRPPARAAATQEEARADDLRLAEMSAEAGRLRDVLSHTLRELEALRALLP
jgi:DNA-binding transcriptional MerR regulator